MKFYEDVAVFPTVSPLVLGHILIAPKRHVNSTLQCSGLENQHIDAILEKLHGLLANDVNTIAIFEHGVGNSDARAAGKA